MVKKYTAIFFMSLASIVMLAFTVFPHHHHQEYICFATTHCENENSATNTRHSHDEGPLNEDLGCVRSLLQTKISRVQSLEHSCAAGHCHHFTIALFFIEDIFQLLSNKAESKTFPENPYREKLHSICLISELAGRAPPRG